MRRTVPGATLVLLVLLVLFAIARPVPADERRDAPPPAGSAPAATTRPYSTADGRFTIPLPAAWTVERAPVGESVAAFDADVPGAGRVRVAVYHIPGYVSARLQPLAERESQRKSFGAREVVVEPDPVPHLWFDFAEGPGLRRQVFVYRVVRRNGVTVAVNCEPAAWPRIRDACLRAAADLTTTVEEWTPAPKEYRAVLRDGFGLRVHPSVPDADVAAVHQRLRTVEAAWAKVHGPVWRKAESPITVIVHSKPADAVKLDWAASVAPHGNRWTAKHAALFVVPPPKDDVAAAAEFASMTAAALLAHSYSEDMPSWLWYGTMAAHEASELTGKPLPAVPEAFVTVRPDALRRLDDLETIRAVDGAATSEMFVYYAYFRCGPKRARDAFSAFLKSAAAGDARTAEAEHILSTDAEELRADVRKWFARGLTEVRTR